MPQDVERRTSSVSDAFDRCQKCGTFLVQLATHRCPSPDGNGQLTRERREQLAEEDPRDPDDDVGVFRRAHGDAYAYHELDGDQPLCGVTANTKAMAITTLSRSAAKDRGKSPCRSCRKVEDRDRQVVADN